MSTKLYTFISLRELHIQDNLSRFYILAVTEIVVELDHAVRGGDA